MSCAEIVVTFGYSSFFEIEGHSNANGLTWSRINGLSSLLMSAYIYMYYNNKNIFDYAKIMVTDCNSRILYIESHSNANGLTWRIDGLSCLLMSANGFPFYIFVILRKFRIGWVIPFFKSYISLWHNIVIVDILRMS